MSEEQPERPGRAFRWRPLLETTSELVGLALLAVVLWLAWPPLPLALLGALLIWIPNRR